MAGGRFIGGGPGVKLTAAGGGGGGIGLGGIPFIGGGGGGGGGLTPSAGFTLKYNCSCEIKPNLVKSSN